MQVKRQKGQMIIISDIFLGFSYFLNPEPESRTLSREKIEEEEMIIVKMKDDVVYYKRQRI